MLSYCGSCHVLNKLFNQQTSLLLELNLLAQNLSKKMSSSKFEFKNLEIMEFLNFYVQKRKGMTPIMIGQYIIFQIHII